MVVRRQRAHAWTRNAVACTGAFLAACSAPPGTESTFDGPSDFVGPSPNGAGGQATTPAASGVPPAVPSANPVASGGEQNPASGAPIVPPSNPSPNGDGASSGAAAGAGGSTMVPADGTAGSSMGVGGPTSTPPAEPPPPVAPNDPSPEEITTFFDSLPCGAQYTALGDGGWQFCLRLSDGGGACARGSAAFQRVAFAGGGAMTDVAQVSGQRDGAVGVVTSAGALHVGGITSISATPLIASGVVNYSAGYHASVALVEQGDGLGVLSWTDNGTPAPVTLPDGAQPIQVSANYGLACALSTAGQAYCWDAGGNHSLQLTATPTRMPLARAVQMISVGQNSVCGVSFDATLECQAAWYDSPFLPTEGMAPNFQVRQSTFPAVRSVHVGFNQGIVVRSDGTAAFLSGGVVPPNDNPGEAFTGVSNIVAAGGDRGSACVMTNAGAVFCRSGGAVTQATLDGAPLTAQAATCPL